MPSSPAPNQPVGRIKIVLPEDRRMAGTLSLHSGNVTLMCVQCLGSSHRRFDQPLGYDRSDRMEIDGDAPLGSFALTFVSQLPRPLLDIGKYWIGLDPVGGEALGAALEGRTGFGIHGGSGETLSPTRGTIRLLDEDMDELYEVANGMRFTVEVASGGRGIEL